MSRLAKRGLLLVMVLGALAAGGWYFYGRSLRTDYEDRIAALRAAGEPTRFEDLAPPPIPDEENGAKLLEEAHRFLEERVRAPDNAEGLLYQAEHDSDLAPDEWARLRAYLDSLGPYFELVARASQRSALHFDHDWSDMRAIPQLQMAGNYLRARVRFDPQEHGHTERAARAAVVLLDLGRKSRGLFLIGHLVTQSRVTDASDILRSAMRRPGFDAALLRRIVDPALEQALPARVPPRRVLEEERVMVIGLVEAMRTGTVSRYCGDASLRSLEGRVSFWWAPIGYRDASRYLDLAERAIAMSETTPEEALAVSLPVPDGRMYPVAGGFGLAHSIVFEKCARGVTIQRLTRVVMALLEHRQREGAWPEKLEELGDMPGDPYGRAPFRYERLDRGCRIRSAKEWPDDLAEDDFLLWNLRDDQLPAMAR